MNCRECSPKLLDFQYDSLPPLERGELAEHLLGCSECRAALDELRRRLPDLLEWRDEELPSGLTARTLERIRAEAAGPAEVKVRSRAPRRPAFMPAWVKAAAAACLVVAVGWNASVQSRSVSLAAALDGEPRLSPGALSTLRMSVFDASSGEPLEGAQMKVALRGPDGRSTVLYEGASDRFGTAGGNRRLPDLPEGGYTLTLTATRGAEATTVERPVEVARRFRVLLSSDKPTYQPGQTIHLRALARETGTGRPPAGDRSLTFTVLDPKGNKVGRSAAKVDGFGVASFDFPLADEILLGIWKVQAELGGSTSELELSVARYALPKLSLKLTTERPWYRPGEVVSGRVEARYFFGKPAAGATAKITAGVFVDQFRPVAEASGKAGADGVFGFELALPRALPGLSATQGSAAVDLALEVVDRAGERAGIHRALTVAEEAVSVSVVPEGGALAEGMENRVFALAVRPDGEPIEGARVTLGGGGNRSESSASTGSDGIAVLPFTPAPGRRDATVRVETLDGASIQRSVELESAALPAIVRTERTLYQAGETVKGEVLGRSPSGAVYLDFARDGETLTTAAVVLDGGRGAFAVDLPAEAAGTVTVFAYTPGREVKRSRKTLFVGEPRSLKVAVRADAESYLPGKEAKVAVEVTGDDGKPVAASVGLALVDESVFALSAKEPALLKAYFLLAQELSKPRYELDPARVVAGGADRDRAASLFFSQPYDHHHERLRETGADELATRRASLAEAQSQASTATWALAFALLGLVLERALRTAAAALVRGARSFVEEPTAPVLVLAFGAALAIITLANGWSGAIAVVLTGAALLILLLARAMGGLAGRFIAAALVLGAAASLALFATILSRPRYAASAEALGAQASPPARGANFPRAAKRTLGSFNAGPDFEGHAPPREPLAALSPDPVPEVRPADRPQRASAAQKAQVRIRSWFPETLFWSPTVITGADGRATVSVPLADSITSWRASATASAADGRLGVGTGALKVFKDFFVEIDLPAALTVGDEVEVPIAVHNYLAAPQTVHLEVESGDWFQAMTPPVQELALGPEEVRGAPLRLRATAFGKKTLTVYALGQSLKDAVRREIEVRPDGVPVEASIGGSIAAPVRVTAPQPAGAIDGSQKVLLRLYPSVVSSVLQGIEGVFQAPHGCFEQTSSTTYPNALVLDYLRRAGRAKPELELKALEYLQLGYQKLLAFEVQGGGFEWFGRAPANQVLTAYGLLELSDMAKVYEVDRAVLARTQEWLASRQEPDGGFAPDRQALRDGLYRDHHAGRAGTTAYVAWALAESGYRGLVLDRAFGFLRARRSELDSLYLKALVANALLAGGRDAEAEELVRSLESSGEVAGEGKVVFRAGTRTAVYSAGSSADVEATALAAAALRRGGRPEKVQGALDWLLSQRAPSGAWSSTQATVLALRALLTAGAAGGQDPSADAQLFIRAGGQDLEALAIRPENSDLVRTLDLTRFARPGAPLPVELRLEGRARLQYQLSTGAYAKKPAADEALTLALTYDRATLSPEDKVTARARATWRRAGPSGMVLLELGVPPGFEVDAGSVGRLVAQGKVAKFTLTGKALLLYVDGLAPGAPLELAYELRARYPVRAKSPASVAYLYYQPEVRAQAPSVDLAVRR